MTIKSKILIGLVIILLMPGILLMTKWFLFKNSREGEFYKKCEECGNIVTPWCEKWQADMGSNIIECLGDCYDEHSSNISKKNFCPLFLSSVTLHTEKVVDYYQGEYVRLTLDNKLESPIYLYWSGCWKVFKYQEDKWNLVYQNKPPYYIKEDEFKEIPGWYYISWDQRIDQENQENPDIWMYTSPGEYRVEVSYTLDSEGKEWKSVYSNIFEIKEKEEDYCDIDNACPQKEKCYKFQDKERPICWSGNPCIRCKSRKCDVAESYPEQVFCK